MEHKNEAHTNPNALEHGRMADIEKKKKKKKKKKNSGPRSWSDFADQAKQYVESVKQYGSFHTLALGNSGNWSSGMTMPGTGNTAPSDNETCIGKW